VDGVAELEDSGREIEDREGRKHSVILKNVGVNTLCINLYCIHLHYLFAIGAPLSGIRHRPKASL
jgi:hypothetical protein